MSLLAASCGSADMNVEMAIKAGDVARIEQLVAGGLDPNVRVGEAPLIVALAGSPRPFEPRIYKFLVSAGARVNDSNPENGTTALHEACGWGSEEHVRVLLEIGANPSSMTRMGVTPLMYLPGGDPAAARRIVDMMIARGADPAARDSSGLSVADHLRKKKLGELASYVESLSHRAGG